MRTDVTPDVIRPLISECNGNLATIAKRLGCSRSTIMARIVEHEDLKIALRDEREAWLDEAESQLYKKIQAGDLLALFFFLKTKGKSRGYIEKIDPHELRQQERIDAGYTFEKWQADAVKRRAQVAETLAMYEDDDEDPDNADAIDGTINRPALPAPKFQE